MSSPRAGKEQKISGHQGKKSPGQNGENQCESAQKGASAGEVTEVNKWMLKRC